MTLAKQPERRQFGRLTTSYHGWVKVAGRPPLPCMVRDLSVTGAGLELCDDYVLPYSFTLVIEAVNFNSLCHVRHQTERIVGVEFAMRVADGQISRHAETGHIARR